MSKDVYIVRYAIVIPIWLLHLLLTYHKNCTAKVSAISAVINILVMAAGASYIQNKMEDGACMFYFILFYFILFYYILFYFYFYFILFLFYFYFILFYFILFCFILFYFILFYFFIFIFFDAYLLFQSDIQRRNDQNPSKAPIRLRIGVHTGSVHAGIIGKRY